MAIYNWSFDLTLGYEHNKPSSSQRRVTLYGIQETNPSNFTSTITVQGFRVWSNWWPYWAAPFYLDGKIFVNNTQVYYQNSSTTTADHTDIKQDETVTTAISCTPVVLNHNSDGSLSFTIKLEPRDDGGSGTNYPDFYWVNSDYSSEQWRDNNTAGYIVTGESISLYTVTYNANGGSGAPSAETKIHNVSYQISSVKPIKSKTTNTIKGSFTITGEANGGYFGSTSVTTTSITATTSRTDTTTYTFKNWNTNSNGTGTSYTSGANYTNNANLVLYAQYTSSTSTGATSYSNNTISLLSKPTKNDTFPVTYTVSFETKGGSSPNSSTSIKTTRKWTFSGWATSASATSANAQASYTSATTLYAYWAYTDTRGKVTLPSPGTREGYEFLGWGTSENQTNGLLATGTQVEISSNIIYYAIWKANGTIRIYLNDSKKFSMTQAYIWNGSKFVLTIPYIYTSDGWKMLGG